MRYGSFRQTKLKLMITNSVLDNFLPSLCVLVQLLVVVNNKYKSMKKIQLSSIHPLISPATQKCSRKAQKALSHFALGHICGNSYIALVSKKLDHSRALFPIGGNSCQLLLIMHDMT